MSLKPLGPGINPNAQEASNANSEPLGGWRRDFPLDIGAAFLDAGDVLSSTSDPNRSRTDAVAHIEWAAADTDAVNFAFTIPEEFNRDSDELNLLVHAHLPGAGANADLALDFSASYIRPGQAAAALTVTGSGVVIGADADILGAGGGILVFGLSSNELRGLDQVTLRLVPNEAIGTNLDLRIYSAVMRISSGINLYDRRLRWNTDFYIA